MKKVSAKNRTAPKQIEKEAEKLTQPESPARTYVVGLNDGETGSRGAGRNPRRGECEPIGWQEAADDFVRQVHGGSEIRTQEYYRSYLSLLGKAMQAKGVTVSEFRVRHLRDYVAARKEKGLSERSIRHDVIAARCFCRFAATERYMPDNPLADYIIPKAEQGYRKSPSEAEVRALLAAVRDRWNTTLNPKALHTAPKARTFLLRRNYAIIAGVVDTGCRIGEMLALRLDDYDAAQKCIHIRKSKGNRPRTLPVSEQWQTACEAWLRVRPKCDSPLLFISRFGGLVSVKDYCKQFQEYRLFARETYEKRCAASGTPADDAFLSHFSLHGLRHYAATLLSEAGWEVARKMLGHSNVAITQRYVHSSADHLRGGHGEAAPLSRLLVSKRSEQARRKKLL